MKKAAVIYLTLLLGVFGILSVSARRDDYVVEKRMWKIYKRQIDVAKDPGAIPRETFGRIAEEYARLMDKYPDSPLMPSIHIRLGEVYALGGDYETARETFRQVIASYPDNNELSAEAMFQIGKTYEFGQNWAEARTVYNRVVADYPGTDTALGVPIYIAAYHRGRNDVQKAMDAYGEAVRYYAEIAAEHDNTRRGLNALRYLSNCYLDQDRWAEAIGILGRILEQYAGSEYLTVKSVDMMIRTINVIAAYQLKDYDAAVRLYRGIIARRPGHPLRGYLEKVIDAFHRLREKGVQVPGGG